VGAIDNYLDTSFLIPLLTAEPASAQATNFALAHPAALVVSNFAAAEFASAVSRLVRMRRMPRHEAQLVLAAFDQWMLSAANDVQLSPVDVALASTFLRRLDLVLRTPDAIHIAIAQRLGATLVTFDQRMASAARVLGLAVSGA
jgi:predicted nucleic acid-binding protein